MLSRKKRLLPVLLVAVILVALSLNSYAAGSNAVTQDGITAQLFTDKDSYEAGESVKADVRVENHTGKRVKIVTSVKVPEMVSQDSSDSVPKEVYLQNNESWTKSEGAVVTAAAKVTTDSAETGDQTRIAVWIVLAICAVGAIVLFAVYGKKNKTWLSMLLCTVMAGGVMFTSLPVQATDKSGVIHLSCNVQVAGKTEEVTATVNYIIYDDADNEYDDGSGGEELPEDNDAQKPVPTSTAILFNENFEYSGNTPDYIASGNDSYGINVADRGHVITPVTDGDNQLLSIKGSEKNSGEFQVDAKFSDDETWNDKTSTSDLTGKTMVYEFDVVIKEDSGTSFNVLLRSVADSTQMSQLCKVDNNVLMLENSSVQATLAEGLHNIAIVCDFENMSRDIYLNGELIAEDVLLHNANGFNAEAVNNLLRFNCSKTAVTSEFWLDNVQVYECDVPVELPTDDESDEDNQVKSEAQLPEVEGAKIFATDFELSNPFNRSYNENIIEWIDSKEEDHGKVMRFERKNEKDFHMQYLGVSADVDYLVYDFDVKLQDVDSTYFSVLLKDDNANYSNVCKIDKGSLMVGSSGQVLKTLAENQWYNIAVVYNYADRVRSIYVDDDLIASNLSMELEFGNADIAGTLRFYCPQLKDLLGEGFVLEDNLAKFMIDNVRVYEGTKPCEELVETEVEIEIDQDKSVYGDTSKLDALLEGYVSLHVRSGMVYQSGTKTKLATSPVESNGSYLVVVEEICSALGISYSAEETTATINGQAANVSSSNGKLWIDAKYLFETILGKTVSFDDTCQSYGMMIAGTTAFTWPSSEVTNLHFATSDLQSLNNYLFFERPEAEKIEEAYKASVVSGQHPRIQATKSDFEVLKEEIKSGQKNAWYQQVIAAADYLLENDDPLIYELRDGVRLLDVSRDALSNMYTLGMAYQLTGEQKYVERAWIDLASICAFPDWHPEHDIDCGEMSAAVAIGYDWMYDGFTAEQRKIIEQGAYKNAFDVACQWYQGERGESVMSTNNHNIIMNGGFTMIALAFMDVYPEEACYMVSSAVHGAEYMLVTFGPDGAWPEGPGYWEYAMQYTSKMLSTLDTAFGTCFELDNCQGLSTAADYMLYMQSDQGIFNYGDGSQLNYYVPEFFYLSNKYENADVTSAVLALNHGTMTDAEDIVLSLLWYDSDITADDLDMALDSQYVGEGVASFRDQWTDGITTYVGIHGGKTLQVHSQLDGGTFIYDYAGVRWAKELGMAPYDLSVAADYSENGGRWKMYKARAESHNTIVINPDDGPDQVVSSTAELTRFETKEKGAITVLDLSANYAENAKSAVRGYFFTDDRNSLVVRDEISLSSTDESIIYWFMQTDAAVEIADDNKSAILTQNGKQVKLEYVTGGENVTSIELSVGKSEPLSTSPVVSGDSYASSTNRIAMKLTAKGDVSITTKLTPVDIAGSGIENYNKNISEWSVEDGTIVEKPSLTRAEIAGRTITFGDDKQATVLFVEGKYSSVPETTATVDTEKYTCEVTNATSFDEATTIVVKDKVNEAIRTTYTVYFKLIPKPTEFDGMTSLQIVGVEASDEPQPANVAVNVIDNKLSTRWSSQGVGQWITVELEEAVQVDNLMMAFMSGNVRQTYITISVSEDGETYEEVYSGKSILAPSTDEMYGKYDLQGKTAKYIKIGCNGNTAQGAVEGWNSITEIVVTQNGESQKPDTTPVITISTQPTDAEVTGGEKAALTVVATATENATVTYQWYSCTDENKTDAAVITGATDATYEVTLTEVGKGYYFCKVSAEGAASVDSDVVTVNATETVRTISFEEDFDSEDFAIINWSGDGATQGIAISFANSGYGITADENDSTDKELSINGTITSGNIDARFSDDDSWADATSTSDVTGKSIVYEFDLNVKADTGTNFNVLLRSIASSTVMSQLCRVENNVLKLENSTVTQTLNTGEHKIAVACDFTNGTRDIYVDGTCLAEDVKIHAWNTFGKEKVNDLLRFTLKESAAYALDNIKVYEGQYTPETVTAPVITIDTQPTLAEVTVGEKAALTVVATATENATVTYQWFSCTDENKNGEAAIDGATAASYEIAPTEAGTGYYFCRVSAEGAASVDSDVVTVTATEAVRTISFEEDFDSEDFATINWSGAGATQGIAISFASSGYGITADENDSTDKELSINGTITSGNIDARFSDDDSWADATSTSDVTGKSIVYEFDLNVKADTGTNFNVLLRSIASSTVMSQLCRVENNVLKLENSTVTQTLNTGEHKIAVACDFTNGTRDIYVDGTCLAEDVKIHAWNTFGKEKVNDLLRFTLKESAAYALDNICVYEATTLTTTQ